MLNPTEQSLYTQLEMAITADKQSTFINNLMIAYAFLANDTNIQESANHIKQHTNPDTRHVLRFANLTSQAIIAHTAH
ncbi:MAG: hypothetical protein ABFQ62_03330 [Patescibacteria group bacterium]